MSTPKIRISIHKLAEAYVERCGNNRLKAINVLNDLINSRRKKEQKLRREIEKLNQETAKYLQIKEVIKLDL